MGRIQRKKAPGGKKRKKQKTTGAAELKSAKGGASGRLAGKGPGETAKAIKKGPAAAVRKTTPGGPAATAKQPGEGVIAKSLQFLREVKVELKKVAWPSRKQTIGSTAVVIALVMLISLFLGVVDMGLSTLIRFVLN